MKSIKDLREQYNLITEKEEAETKKLAALVRAGLFDAKKLTSLKRALDKPVDKMTAQEKRMLLNLLDALMSEVLSNQPVYQKVKQNVMKESVVVDTKDYLTKMDPRVKRYGYSQKEAPSVLLLKRKAIRVFPDGQKVALYYAQAIDKYVSIPFSEIGINETWLGDIVRGIVRSVSGGNDSSSSSTKKDEDGVAKELKPLEREKTKLKISTDDEIKNRPYLTGTEIRRQNAEREANARMAKGIGESFRSNLQALEEESWQPTPSITRNIFRNKPKNVRSKTIGIAKKLTTVPKGGNLPKNIKPSGEITSRDPLPTEKISAALEKVYGDNRAARERIEKIGKAASALSFGTTDIAGSYLDAKALAKRGEGYKAAKEFGLGVVAPLAGGAILGRMGGKVARDAERAVSTRAAKDFDIAPPKSGVEVPTGLKDITPTASSPKGIEKSPKMYEPPKTTSEVPKPAQTAAERKTKYSMDLEVQRETNRRAAEAMRKAAEFRTKYPKSKDTTVSTLAKEPKEFKTQVSTKEKEPVEFKAPEVAMNKGKVVPVNKSRVSTKEKEPVEFKAPEVAVSKGELVPVKAREPKEFKSPVSIKAREPSDTTYNKSTVGKWPELSKETSVDSKKKTRTEPRDETQVKPQRKKPDDDTVKTKNDEPAAPRPPKPPKPPRKPFKLPALAADVGAKALTAMTPGLKLAISGPKREGDADAIRSRLASYERRAWQAQAAMTESVEIDLNGNRFVLNNEEANKVISLYESLNTKNKQKMIKMMNESEEQLNKIVSFAVRQ